MDEIWLTFSGININGFCRKGQVDICIVLGICAVCFYSEKGSQRFSIATMLSYLRWLTPVSDRRV